MDSSVTTSPRESSAVGAASAERVLRVRGTVQGVGFRPFVLRLATELGLVGWVRNDADGVLVRAVGPEACIAGLAEAIVRRAPPAARVMEVRDVTAMEGLPEAGATFVIAKSPVPEGEVGTDVAPDLAPCPDCLRELADPDDRRHGYPFINCTQCGPRYTIVESLPYDRPRTTMSGFPLCAACTAEYGNPRDRRFHAEPNACPACGPRVRLTDPDGRARTEDEASLAEAAEALRSGRVLAVKGVGGYHLMVEAGNAEAVAELRRRKHREEKPFAVMFPDIYSVRRSAEVGEAQEALLVSPRAPIVLLQARAGGEIAGNVAPGSPWIGVLLPPSPLHRRLLEAVGRPVVATSGNLADEPLCIDGDEARERLEGIADFHLDHNRPIARPVDDSVVRFTGAGAPIVLRRARGYAPGPLSLPRRLESAALCVGAQMKTTVGVASGGRVVLSPHIGDLGSLPTLRAYERTIAALSGLLTTRIETVVHDKHPDYDSTRLAERMGLRRVAVQHHLAHVLAVLLEHRREPDEVLGVAWDGTGYGEDGTVWGGEFIDLAGGGATRLARFRPFPLAGGEAAVRDARRVALVLADDAGGAGDGSADGAGLGPTEAGRLRQAVRAGLNAPRCGSVGRIFDGFGVLLGLGRRNAFEGQIPLAVESAASGAEVTDGSLPFAVERADPGAGATWEIDWRPAVVELLASRQRGPRDGAVRLHRGLVQCLVDTARLSGRRTVVLSGGCFQNALLRDLAEAALAREGVEVLCARELPPNDGAIAAGQAAALAWNLTAVHRPPSTAL
jgi:hydrogenase maturation protein HypF